MRTHATQYEAGLAPHQISFLYLTQGEGLIAANSVMFQMCRRGAVVGDQGGGTAGVQFTGDGLDVAGGVDVDEMGGCGMGKDPATSVVDADLRHHRVKNLFVVDGSALPTALGVNPCETIYGLAHRARDVVAGAV